MCTSDKSNKLIQLVDIISEFQINDIEYFRVVVSLLIIGPDFGKNI